VATDDGNQRRVTNIHRRRATGIHRRRTQWPGGDRPKIIAPHMQARRVTTCIVPYVKCVLFGPCMVTEIPWRCLALWEKARACVGTRREWRRGDWMEVEFLHSQPKSGFSIYLRCSLFSCIRLSIVVGPWRFIPPTYHCIKMKKKLVQCLVTTQTERTPDRHKLANQLNTTWTINSNMNYSHPTQLKQRALGVALSRRSIPQGKRS
jgi:hypothetical protein